MNWQDASLVLAGLIGSGVAIVHGVLVQRLMVRPLDTFFAEARRAASIRRLVPLLLHFSTVAWFVGGLALIAAAACFGPEAKRATGLLVGGAYLFGALANLWATRGLHPGWMLYAVAILLIAFGIS